MPKENLQELSLEDLLMLLAKAQRNLALSRLYHQSDEEIRQNKLQLEQVQKAIVDKREDPIRLK